MNLCNYQEKARSTAIYLDIEHSRMIYPALGLVGECGEVVEKIKKLIRDDNGEMPQSRKDDIKKELGDVMWYCANVCCDADLCLDMMYKMKNASTIRNMRNLTFPQLVLHMSSTAAYAAQALEKWASKYDCRIGENNRFTEIPHCLTCIIVCVEEIATRCDFTLEEVCTTNLDKLLDRKERGTLKGEGDNR